MVEVRVKTLPLGSSSFHSFLDFPALSLSFRSLGR
jgi:hypothetical protein